MNVARVFRPVCRRDVLIPIKGKQEIDEMRFLLLRESRKNG